ncbi:YcaO-like family protein [Mycolicibacterium sp. 120266]|uniref:YcaO-like family protein n=1 Tax=Mycolicibacterium sp. 120266 TaxID=3090601 RepID=UPI00299DD485|nr:YcaO-like family protein [Mycolicibacterium sp. 120266]MDX1873295.1 YcaO-like family protein [Mycolicibacterium sp. 120266]
MGAAADSPSEFSFSTESSDSVDVVLSAARLPTYPLMACAARPSRDGIVFFSGTNRVTVRNHSDAIWDLIETANGECSYDDVVQTLAQLGYAPEIVAGIIVDLFRLGILIDSRMLYTRLHAESQNPMRYNGFLRIGQIIELEKLSSPCHPDTAGIQLPRPHINAYSRRGRSCRRFDGQPIKHQELADILAAASHQKPSAGNLQTLRFFIVQNCERAPIAPGIYEYNQVSHSIRIIHNFPFGDPEVRFALNEESAIYNSAVVVIICAALEYNASKYANRGYRYALIESGLAVERILDCSSRLNISSLVYGGFNDAALAQLIATRPASAPAPLICVALGTAAEYPNARAERLDSTYQLVEPAVGEGRPVRWASLVNGSRLPGDLSCHQALSLFAPTAHDSRADSDERLCGGTAPSSLLARTKAIVEALERYYSGMVRVDALGTSAEINAAYAHNMFSPLTAEQIDAQDGRLQEFRDDAVFEWVIGRRVVSGAAFPVPIDITFYPLSGSRLGRPLTAFANSSGVAAHSTALDARKNALLELIERDAILRAWYTENAPPQVHQDAWTAYIKRRADYWHQRGFTLRVHRFPCASAVVIGVSIVSDSKFPHFCFGSAASFDTPTDALVKAYQEAEVALAGYRAQTRPDRLQLANLRTPLDHGLFYAQSHSNLLDEFMTANTEPSELSVASFSWHSVLQILDPIEVDLDPEGASGLKVVRMLSEKMLPINFGVGMEHRTHPTLEPSVDRRPSAVPHFIA